jgi:hypothetical protein
MLKNTFILTVLLGASALPALAWDYEGHRVVNQLALAALPAAFPAFVLTPENRERIAYLAGEPDRWRSEENVRAGTGLALGHVNGPDHYLDLEDLALYDLKPDTLPPLRYDFVAAIVKARAAHPDRFPAIDPARDSDHTRELSGFLPWSITENYEKLQSGFSTLAALEKFGGTSVEITNAKANIVYVMGVMGHYVGDASQPLHTTMHFNGWVGANPHNYTTGHSIHSWIDGGFFRQTGGLDEARLAVGIHPAETIPASASPDGIFHTAVDFVVANNRLVEPLYQLDRDGKLSADGTAGAEGRAFLEAQLVKSGQLLGNLWLTAWQSAPEDTYLERELKQRPGAVGPAK